MIYNLSMTNQKQELTFQQQINNKRQEIVNYEEMLERYRSGPSRTNRWYNSGRRALEELNDELKALKIKHKRRVRLNMSLVRCNNRLRLKLRGEHLAVKHSFKR